MSVVAVVVVSLDSNRLQIFFTRTDPLEKIAVEEEIDSNNKTGVNK